MKKSKEQYVQEAHECFQGILTDHGDAAFCAIVMAMAVTAVSTDGSTLPAPMKAKLQEMIINGMKDPDGFAEQAAEFCNPKSEVRH